MSNAGLNFVIQDFSLQCGVTLPTATVTYQTYGKLNSDRSNVILYPTSYGAQHHNIDWLIRPNDHLCLLTCY